MTLPPTGYSGLEMLAWQIGEGLKAKGHEVLLIAPKETKTTCELHGTTLGESEQQAYSGYRQRLKDYNCIIDHSWQKWAYVAKMRGEYGGPVLGVLHAPVRTMYQSPPPMDKPCLVCISHDQAAETLEHLKRTAMVAYNGVDTTHYKWLQKARNNRYLFLARFSSIKGPDIAIEVAKAARVGLDLVGDDKITGEPELLKNVTAACALTPGLTFIGPQSRAECANWFNSNKCLLHPIMKFREPFGLAPVESQLCGMPVISWDNGAMRETIKPGETGFLVKSADDMVSLINSDAVSLIKPERCVEWASQFSYEKMIDRYEELCKEAILGGGW